MARSTGLDHTIPVKYQACAANMARWFPEVFMTLGSPELEECFVASTSCVEDSPRGKRIELAFLDRTGGAVSAPAKCDTHPDVRSREAILDGLDQLASDIGSLAARLAERQPEVSLQEMRAPARAAVAVEASILPMEAVARENRTIHSRLDAATDEVLSLASQLQMLQAQTFAESAPSAPTFEPPAARSIPEDGRQIEAIREAQSSQTGTCTGGEQMLQKSQEGNLAEGPVCEIGTKEAPAQVAPKALQNDPTPRSCRGYHQVRQSGSESDPRLAGRSRSSAGKASAWRRQQPLTIAVHKVQQLQEEPSSPKFVKRGRRPAGWVKKVSFESSDESRSVERMKERFEQKLAQTLGPTGVGNRLPGRSYVSV